MKKIALFLWIPFFLSACQGASPSSNASSSQPILHSALPNHGRASERIRLRGVGFSVLPSENWVSIGGELTPALSYRLVPAEEREGSAGEEILFSIPSKLQSGEVQIFVMVEGEISNALSFTID